ncbi:MAG: hypothetical protein Q9202_002731 [Teloschistes flavicans]
MRPDVPRTTSPTGPPTPSPPFPIRLSGPIVQGFGRGSRELGIPTANIPIAGLSVGGHEGVESGVYYGWAGLNVTEEGEIISSGGRGDVDGKGERVVEEGKNGEKGMVYPMVMSIGWNPFYKNTVRSVEVHLLHTFPHDFYSARMNLLILGHIRPEYDYVSKDSLIDDINIDIEVARASLRREGYAPYRDEAYLLVFGGEGHEGDVAS